MTDPNLNAIFQTVSAALAENQSTINQADSLNHNHGDDMVEIFNVISKAVDKKKTASPSVQLKYASKQLEKKGTSGTSQVYAQGLKQASQKFSGKELSSNTAIDFIQTLMGGAAQSTGSTSDNGDLMGSLIGGMMGSQTQDSNPTGGSSELLSSLLSGMMGGQTDTQQPTQAESPVTDILSGLLGGSSQTNDGKFDLSDVAQIGMGYMQAKQSGSSDIEALAGAILNRTQMGQKEHRAASGKVVAQTLLDAITQFAK